MSTFEKSGGRIPSEYVMDPYCPMFLEANIGKDLYLRLNAARINYMKQCFKAEKELLEVAIEALEKWESTNRKNQ